MSGVNIANMFIAAAQRWRDRPAIESAELTLTHEQLIRRAARIARHLCDHGVREGDHVGIALASAAESMAAMIALWMLNAVVVPLDFRSSGHERRRLVESLHIRFILEPGRPADMPGCRSIPVDDNWEDALRRYPSEPPPASPAEHPALLSLTSGTSGIPQAMVLEHRTWYCRSTIHLLEQVHHPGARYLNPTPVSFASSRNRSLTWLLSGGTVIFFPVLFSAEELAEGINAMNADYTSLVPTVLRDLLGLAGNGGAPLFPGLGMLDSRGASISGPEKFLVRERLTPNLIFGYGTSGTGNVAYQTGAEIDTHPDSVGRPFPVVLVQIVDEDGGIVPAGETGSIRVKSPGNISRIYGGAQGADDSKGDRIADGWVYPGDLGSLGEDGYLTIDGRSANMIVRGGANVYPAELEAVLNEHPAVVESAVVGSPSITHGEEIAAFLVTDGSVTRQKLMAFCRSRFAPNKRPRRLFIVDSLPRSPNGKVLHRELAARLKSDEIA